MTWYAPERHGWCREAHGFESYGPLRVTVGGAPPDEWREWGDGPVGAHPARLRRAARRCADDTLYDPQVPDTITPADTTGTAEAALHPDFVMPPFNEALDPWAALEKWDADLREQARAAYPGEEQWLERACYPGSVPAVPLAEYDGTLLPPAVAAHRTALSRRAWKVR